MNKKLILLLLVLLTPFVFLFCIFFGSVKLEIYQVLEGLLSYFRHNFTVDTSSYIQLIIFKIRMPRLLMSFLAGGILSMVGLLMQTITKNPLAEPYVLGISAGASAGAVSAIILGWFSFFAAFNVYAAAFIGASLATMLVILLQGKSQDTVRLVLIGMGVNAFFTSLTTFLVYSSNNEAQVRSAMFWTTGSLSGIHFEDLIPVAIGLAILIIFYYLVIKELDILLLGHKAAQNMGLHLFKLQIFLIVVSSLSIALLVSKVGVIGFVGLIVPHISRKLIGVKHNNLLFATIFIGGMGLMVIDTFARTIFSPNELPIGVMTGIIGAPIFIYILNSTREKI